MIIWRSVPVTILRKLWYVKKLNGRLHRGLVKDFGDVPVCRFNKQTGKIETVINKRGLAYAARNRQKYQKQNLINKRKQS